MDSGVAKLLKFIHKKTSRDCQEFLSLAYSSFFEDFLEEGYSMDLTQIAHMIGEDRFSQLHPCALEFFFSNEYPSPENPDVMWNVIDIFLQSQEKKLLEEEKTYLRGLRDSYMSVYEVVDVTLDKSLTLRDMIQGGEPIIVQEKSATHFVVQWDRLGARIVREEGRNLLAGAVLPLKPEAADEAIAGLRFMMQGFKKMMTVHVLKKMGMTKEKALLLQRKLWVKEIASVYMATPPETPALFNSDDDPLQFCELTFAVKGNKKLLIEKLDNLPELDVYESDKRAELCWVWVLKEKRKAKKESLPKEQKGLYIEMQIEDRRTHKNYPVFAELTLRGRKLIIDVNSRQRAYILEDYITTHLQTLVDAGNIVFADMEEVMKQSELLSKKTTPSQEEQQMLLQFKDNYYREWLESAIPALDDLTPRQASKTISGRKKLVELLKYMENMEMRGASKEEPAYDLSWLWRELRLEKDSV